MKLDHAKMKSMLEEQGFGNVKVEPSVVTGSPHDYVYVYLTPAEHEGKHIIISEGAEYGDEGLLVGWYPHFEEPSPDDLVTVNTLDEALAWCVSMATDYTVGDRNYWVDKAKKRGWAIHKLITNNEKLQEQVKELEAKLKVTDVRNER